MSIAKKIEIIIFLDIDGVVGTNRSLNHAWESYCGPEGFEGLKASGLSHPRTSMYHWPFDLEAIDCIHALQLHYSSKGHAIHFVISSTWRMGRNTEDLNEVFSMKGLHLNKIIGRTSSNHSPRGKQIQEWLNDHRKPMFADREPFVYLSIDDDNNYDVKPHLDEDHCVTPLFDTGFNKKERDEAVIKIDKQLLIITKA